MDVVYHFNKNFFLDPKNYDGNLLYQIGRCFCRENTVVDTHIHKNLFELTIVTDGEGTVSTNGVSVPVERNDICLSFPYDAHKIESDPDRPLRYDFFAFHSENAEYRAALDAIVNNYPSAQSRVFRDERIAALVGNAIEEFDNDRFRSEQLLSSIFHEILIYLIRDFGKMEPEKRPKNVQRAEAVCLRMMNYIDTHVYSIKNLEEIADAMGYSYSYLSSLFKRMTSHTLSRYYHEKKLETARVLLLENRMKITEISERLNYASVYAFSKAFRAKFGLSPRAYRQRERVTGTKTD